MSVLEFISSVKWPIVVLVLAGIATWHKPARALFSSLLNRLREVKFPGGSLTLDAGEPATISDDAIIDRGIAQDAQGVQQLRREAVEEIIRQAAAWGWDAAHLGTFQQEPIPMIRWDGDKPTIQQGVAGVTEQHTRLLQQWYHSIGGA